MYVRKLKHKFKPDYPVQINWAHPMAKKLKGFWLFNETKGQIRNIVDGTVTTLTSGTTVQQVGRYGRELDHNAANGFPVFTSYDLPNEFSVFTLCKYNSNTIDHAVFDYATQSPVLWADTLSSQLRPALYSGGAVSYGSSNSLSVATGYNTWGAVMRSNNTENRFFVNGDFQGVGNPGTWAAGANTFRLLANNAGAKNSDSNTVWVVMFERALSYDEARWLTKLPTNVYELLQPTNIYIPIYVPAAGTTITPSVASITIAGQSVSVILPTFIDPVAGSFSIAGSAITMTFNRIMLPSVGSYSIAGQNVNLFTLTSIDPATGSISIAGQAISLTKLRILAPTNAILTIDGQSVTVDAVFVQSKETGLIFNLVGPLVSDLIKEIF